MAAELATASACAVLLVIDVERLDEKVVQATKFSLLQPKPDYTLYKTLNQHANRPGSPPTAAQRHLAAGHGYEVILRASSWHLGAANCKGAGHDILVGRTAV